MQEKYTIESKIFLFFLLVVRWNVYLICTHNWFNEHFTYFSQIQIIFFKNSSKKLNLTLHRCCITGTLKLCKYMSLTIHKALLLFSNFHQFICHKCWTEKGRGYSSKHIVMSSLKFSTLAASFAIFFIFLNTILISSHNLLHLKWRIFQ